MDHAWFGPTVCAGDRGYDSGSNYARLLDLGIAPVLHKRDLMAGELHYGVYTGDGVPTCFGRDAAGVCPYRCGYGLLCLSVVGRMLGRWRELPPAQGEAQR